MSQSESASVDSLAQDIANDASEAVSVSDVADSLDELINDFKVGEDEAERTVRNQYDAFQSGNEEIGVGNIDSEGEWYDIEVQVLDLWDSDADAVGQTGLVGDESGVIKFTAWAKSDLPELEVGESYKVENVVTDEWNGDYNIKLHGDTTVSHLDEDIDVADDATSINGVVATVQSGSGLVKRCPEDDCTRVLRNGRCSEHGSVNGEFDLRIKAIVDDGETPHQVIFGREATEDLLGMSLQDAMNKAKQEADASVIGTMVEDELEGSLMHVNGGRANNYVIAEDWGAIQSADSSFADIAREAQALKADL
jgi:replication factor A1